MNLTFATRQPSFTAYLPLIIFLLVLGGSTLFYLLRWRRREVAPVLGLALLMALVGTAFFTPKPYLQPQESKTLIEHTYGGTVNGDPNGSFSLITPSKTYTSCAVLFLTERTLSEKLLQNSSEGMVFCDQGAPPPLMARGH